jgi:uncharacterized protein DUF3562
MVEPIAMPNARLTYDGKFAAQKSHADTLPVNLRPMNDQARVTGEQDFNRPVNAETEIELLARETQMPRELVASLYTRERARLERTAKIKTYVPVLIHRYVKALLREQYRA